MNRCCSRLLFVLLVWLAFPQRSPAPLIYVPGEGWHYEAVGSEGNWRRESAKEQYEVALTAFNAKKYGVALKSAKRIVSHPRWKFGDYAAPAQYLVGRSYEAEHQDEKAFKAYQTLIEQYPKVDNYEEVVKRQFLIANRFLGGQFFRVFGYIPLYRSMEKTVKLYEQIIKNGPFSEVAPAAQMNIGLAHENKKGFFIRIPDYPKAAKAYQTASERYADQKIGIDALYREALAYTREASEADKDQTVASQAIATFTQFISQYPEDPRIRQAQKIIDSLKIEQARGSYEVARFYEKNHKWKGALIYYNDVLLKDPGSKYSTSARQRIEAIQKRGVQL